MMSKCENCWGYGACLSSDSRCLTTTTRSFEFKSYLMTTYTGDDEEGTYECTGEDTITVREHRAGNE